MEANIKKSYILLHIAVFLFGMTAIFGAVIDLSALVMVWWRVLITSASLLFIPIVIKSLRKMPWVMIYRFLGIGAVVALHWITFYGAIKLSNASVTLVCFALVPFFTSFIEPMVVKKPFNKTDAFVSLLLIPGIILIVQDLENTYFWGIVVGLFSAFLVAIFSTFTKKYIEESDPITISFLQITGALLSISLVLPFILLYNPEMRFIPIPGDWIYILLLSLLCTSIAYVLATMALKHITAFSSNLIVNLEPIYGILMAIYFLNENNNLNYTFYFGALVLFSVVLGYPIYKSRKRQLAKKKIRNLTNPTD